MEVKRIYHRKPLALLASVGLLASGGLLMTGLGGGTALAAGAAARASGTLTTQAPTGYVSAADWNPFSPSSTAMTAVAYLAFSPLAIISDTNRDLGHYYYGQLARAWGYTDHYHLCGPSASPSQVE